MTEKEIFIEKLTEPLPSYMLTAENHTNYSIVSKCSTWLEVFRTLSDEGYNFLGITTPPYNPYGKHLNFAFVMEDIYDDYAVCWHHISDMWLDKIAKDCGANITFRTKT